MDIEELHVERLNNFLRQADPNLRLLPPSRNGPIEYIKRATLQGGWIWIEARTNVQYQDPELWGWKFKDRKYLPKWQSEILNTQDIYAVIKTCSCKTALCRNCKCEKDGLKCLTFCLYQLKCETKC